MSAIAENTSMKAVARSSSFCFVSLRHDFPYALQSDLRIRKRAPKAGIIHAFMS